MIACAARELFEELGVLAARGAEHLTKGQLESVLDDLTSGRMSFAVLLKHYGLRLDARDFTLRRPLGDAALQPATLRHALLRRALPAEAAAAPAHRRVR